MLSLDLAVNAVVAGLLLGGFYAAVTIGVTISFGMLDIVNIAHPAFIMLGSFVAYIVNSNFGIDPILIGVVMAPVFFLVGMAAYQVYFYAFEQRGEESIQGLAFFFGLLFVGEVALILIFGVDYRFVEAPYIGPSLHFGFVDLPLRMLIPCLVSLLMLAVLQLFLGRTFIGRAILAVSQDRLALQLMAANPSRVKRIAFGISIPAGRAVDRPRLYRADLRDLRARRHDELSRHARRGDADRYRRKHHRDVLWAVLGARGGLWVPALDPRGSPRRHPRALIRRWAPPNSGASRFSSRLHY